MQPFTVHPLVLTPLSPIHIGSGVELDWTQAVLDGDRLVLFDPLRAELPPAALDQLAKAADDRNPGTAMIRLQKLFKAHRNAFLQVSVGEVQLTAAMARKFEVSLGRNVQAAQDGNKVVSELSVSRHATEPTSSVPYVPGTSLKGALRTAAIARLDGQPKTAGPRPPDGRNAKGQPFWSDPSDKLLGAFDKSMFSRVLVSDLTPVASTTGLVAEVRNWARRPKGHMPEGKVPVTVELMQPFVPGACSGEIRIGRERGPEDPVKAHPDLARLLRDAHQFHIAHFQEAAAYLDQPVGLMPQWLRGVQGLLGELQPRFAEGRAALVRLGKFCSAESKTVSWRSVRVKVGKSDYRQMLNSTTFWLADLGAQGRLPLGWAIVELGSEPSAAVRAFCEAMAGAGAASPAAAAPGQPAFRPAVGTRVRVGDRMGKIIYEEDGEFTVELDNGDEINVKRADLRPA